MIGAIVLAYQKNLNYLKQDVYLQQVSNRDKLIKLVDPKKN